MLKDRIKFVIENASKINDEVRIKLDEVSDELFIEDMSIEELQAFYEKYRTEIFEPNGFSFEELKIYATLNGDDRETREKFLGIDDANQFLKGVVELYGEGAKEYLKCNKTFYNISELEGLVSGEVKKEHEDFYSSVLRARVERATNIKSLGDILVQANSKYINFELIEAFANHGEIIVLETELNELLDELPENTLDGESVKLLIRNINHIRYGKKTLERVPPELFDETFTKGLIEKSKHGLESTLDAIPESARTKGVWELVVAQKNYLFSRLPEKKLDEFATEEEFLKWRDDLIISVLREHTDDIKGFYLRLEDYQKTNSVNVEAIRLIDVDSVHFNDFFNAIPKEKRTREIYEILASRTDKIFSLIPKEPFEEGMTQEEYDLWFENILVKTISERDNLDNILLGIPKEKITGNVWNALIDRCNQIGESKSKFGLNVMPIYNMTPEICERALKEVSDYQISNIPYIDRNLDSITDKSKREEYEKWISSFSEEEKDTYRQWYEDTVLAYMERNRERQPNLFTSKLDDDRSIKIPPEAITRRIIDLSLDIVGPTGLFRVPVPNEFTRYNEQYEDIVISAINMLEEKDFVNPRGVAQQIVEDYDFISIIPEEYRTDRVIVEAIKKHPKYLNYANRESEEFDNLLQIGYKNKLKSMGRESFTADEISLIKRFAKNNATLFSTLKLEILTPEIVNSIGENSLEKIVRYSDVQNIIIDISKNKESLATFGFVLDQIKEDDIFIEPLIEELSRNIKAEEVYHYNSEKSKSEHIAGDFLRTVYDRLQDESRLMTDEEKVIISYLTMNPSEANNIKSYDDILNFIKNKNAKLDEIINSNDTTVVGIKDAYFQRVFGMNYRSAANLVAKYGNDPEELLAKYEGRILDNPKEIAEKEALERIIKLKAILDEKDISKIRESYSEYVRTEETTRDFEKYRQSIKIDSVLRRAYGRNITQSIDERDKENNEESIAYSKEGQEYLVRKLKGPFNRMVSLLGAYGKSESDGNGDMYDRWNTNKMADNHALCYSFLNQSNPGTALTENKKGIIIAISGFDAEAVIAAAPYDVYSESRQNTLVTYRPQKFYTAENLPDETRGHYSEIDIEIQDVSEGVTEYRKIQPTSIICFEEIDEDSINAAIELSNKLGRKIPIELIDRRELAKQEKIEINKFFNEFINGDGTNPELIGEIITRYNNVRNAHIHSSLSDELLGESDEKEKSNPNALFNKKHLNKMISDCIDKATQIIESGDVKQGLAILEQIKQSVRSEREKYIVIPVLSMPSIDLNIDRRIREIQREYGEKENQTGKTSEFLQIIDSTSDLDTVTYSAMYGEVKVFPKQMSLVNMKKILDMGRIKKMAEEVHQEGYYTQNKAYSEEHIVRTLTYANAIAKLEGADEKSKTLLMEAVKYSSSGMVLDIGEEPHHEYSAQIAGRELAERYNSEDVGIIQAVIELQGIKYSSGKVEEQILERREKISNLCDKYGIDVSQSEKIETISRFMGDALELDKARFVKSVNSRESEKFEYYNLKTESAKKLMGVAYGIQDKIAEQHLSQMATVAKIDFDLATKEIMQAYFVETIGIDEKEIFDREITKSPVVREAYLRRQFPEIDFDEYMGIVIPQIDRAEENDRQEEQVVNGEQGVFDLDSLPTPDFSKLPPVPPMPDFSKLPPLPTMPIASMDGIKSVAETRTFRDVSKATDEVKENYVEIENPNQTIDENKKRKDEIK